MDPFSDWGAGRRRLRTRSSNSSTPLRRAALLLAAGVAVIAVVLIFAVTGGGGPGDRADSAGSEASPDQAQSSGQRMEEQPGGPATTTGDGGDGGDEVGDAGRESDVQVSDNGEANHSADGGPIPDRAQDPDVAPEDAGEDEIKSSHSSDSHDGSDSHHGPAYVTAPEGEADAGHKGHEAHEWRENQPETGYDPLGRDAEAGALTGTEERRVRFAAANFVTYGYGYTGDDLQEYRSELSNTVVETSFEGSPGRADIKAVEEDIQSGGLESAAVLERFEVEETNEDEVKGVAYFIRGGAYDGGGVSGQTKSYAQALNLESAGGGWRVVAADRLEEASGD